MEDHVNVTVTTEVTTERTWKSNRVADARRQIFSGATAGEYVTLSTDPKSMVSQLALSYKP